MTAPIDKLTIATVEKLLQSSTDSIVVVDDDGLIVLVNVQAERLFGYASNELTGKPVETLVPDAHRTRHRQHRKHYRGTPHARPLVSGLKLQGRRKDGSTFDAEIALTPIDDHGRRLVASNVREFNAVDTSEAYFRNLLEAAPDAMVIVDADGRIAIANNQAETMFGYSRKQLLGQPVETLLPETARDRHVRHRQRYLEHPRVRPMGIDMELYGRRADGSEFPVEISLSPVKSANGSFVSSVIRDVTRRKQMETELINARLAAERAHKANSTFLAAASHDLRQPVQALCLLNGALRRTVNEPLAREMIESQQHSLDAMTNLLNSLLDISRLDAGAVKPAVEEFPVRRLIDRLSAESARQARQKKLVFTATATGAIIRSDPNLLGEIIQNFIANAIRYTESGEVTLSCRSIDGRLSIDVCDTGIGIAESQLDSIFSEFHQLRSPGIVSEGFGLGLAIVRRLADLMDHEVRVTSTPGKGSCFSVLVPAVGEQETRESAISAERYIADEASGAVLLIEDDPQVAGAWTLLLQSAGYQVLTAQSADGAVAAARQLGAAPDLIISDFHLIDGSNGLQAVTRIREYFGRDLPAFVVSGDTSRVVDDAKHLRNSVLLSKPVNTDALLDLALKTIATGSVPDA